MSDSELPAHEWRHRVFIYYVAVMLLVFLLPVPATPLTESKHVDKLVHFMIFLGFALLFYVDRRWKVWWTFLISVAFAGAIGLVQWTLPYREGDWWDFVAGAAGAGLGAVLVLLMERQARRVAVIPGQSGEDPQPMSPLPTDHDMPGNPRRSSRRDRIAFGVYALLIVGLLTEVGARVLESQRGNLEWRRLRRGNTANLYPYQMTDPQHPGNWVLRPNYRQTYRGLIAARQAGGRVLGVEHFENALRRLGLSGDSLGMRINAAGFRGPEIDTTHSRVRVLALGNSVTFGTLEETTYPRLMEAELRSGGAAVEVINGGVEGYGPKQHLLQLDRYQRLRPDIVTIYLGWNALFDEHPKVLRGWLASADLARRVLLRLQHRGSPQAAALALYHRPKRADPTAIEVAKARAYEPSFLEDIDSLVRASQALRARVVLITLTGLYAVNHAPTPKALEIGHLPPYTDNPYVFATMVDRYNEALRRIAHDRGADLIDAAVWGDTALVPRDEYFFDSVHLWEDGQVKLGRFLGQQLGPLVDRASRER